MASETNAVSEIQPPAFHLESLECMMKMPVVEAAYNQGASMYEKVKGANYMLTWALTTAETTVQRALTTATPLVHKLDKPIHMVDQTLVKGIQTLQVKAPIVNQEPQQIYEAAKSVVTNAMQPTLNKVCAAKSYGENKALTLKELSWNKANEVLATQYGQMAVMGVDSTTAMAEKLIDYYFPATQGDNENNGNAPISASEDPVLHTVQTVGRLSNKAARRVYTNVSTQLRSLNVQDVKEYVASLIAVLQLTQLLHYFDQKSEKEAPKTEEKPAVEEESKEKQEPSEKQQPSEKQ